MSIFFFLKQPCQKTHPVLVSEALRYWQRKHLKRVLKLLNLGQKLEGWWETVKLNR